MTAIEIQAALSAYFAPHEIGWKPQSVSGNRALAVAYIDARNVMDRLDSVLGIENWQDSYTVLPDGNVVCTLSIRVGDEWVQKTDVGGESDQKDEGDRCKAAFCLPLDAQALTLSGWTTYDRLQEGDAILGYDLSSKLCRWTPVTAINVFQKNQDILGLSSKSFNMACTPNHRWVVNRRGVGAIVKPTNQLDTRDRIVVAAPAEGGTHQLVPREASIIGWLATDGSVVQCPDKRPGRVMEQFHAWINQSKVINRDSIRALVGAEAVEHIQPAGMRHFPGHDSPSATLERSAFRLETHYAKSLLSRAGLYDGEKVRWENLSGLVTRLTTDSRQALFNAMMAGDGQHAATGQRKFGKKRKPGVLDAFEILCALEGIALGTLHGSEEYGSVPLRTLRKSQHTWSKCLSVTHEAPEPVWCPTTGLGTWVTKWSGQITITGNSDALKRAAVKLGVGRYLYELPLQWCDYDPQKRQFSRQPALPDWATPGREKNKPAGQPTPPTRAPEKPKPPPLSEEAAKRRQALIARDEGLSGRKLCKQFDLMRAAQAAAVKAGCEKTCETWTEEAWKAAEAAAEAFEAQCLANAPATEFELEQLDALIARKGETRDRVLTKLRKKPGEPLTSGDADRATVILSELPEAQQRKTVKGK